MARRNYPIVLGSGEKPNKVVVGVKAGMGAGYDVMILGMKDGNDYRKGCNEEELADALDGREYATLRFCTMESLDTFIKLLQNTKKLWEKEKNNHGK